MATSTFAADHGRLIYMAKLLQSVGTDLDEHRGPETIDGLEGSAQDCVKSAVEDFRHQWRTSFRSIVDDISDWSGLSLSISSYIHKLDATTAAIFDKPTRDLGILYFPKPEESVIDKADSDLRNAFPK